jgi:hypothetical protein
MKRSLDRQRLDETVSSPTGGAHGTLESAEKAALATAACATCSYKPPAYDPAVATGYLLTRAPDGRYRITGRRAHRRA